MYNIDVKVKASENPYGEVFSRIDSENLPESPPNYPPLASWRPLDRKAVPGRWRRSISDFPNIKPVLYVHIPFCATVCKFCGFYKKRLNCRSEIGAYLKNLGREIDFFKSLFRNLPLRSVCIGGGTPSLLNIPELGALFEKIHASFKLTRDTKLAFEASPDSLDFEKLKFLKKSGVDWLAIGVQSLDEKLLEGLNRFQSTSHALRVIRQARDAGINQVEVDLMVGLAGQTEESFLSDVKTISGMDVERVYLFDFQPRKLVALEGDKGGSMPPESLKLSRASRRKALDILIDDEYLMRCGHWVYKRNGGNWPYSYDQGEDGSYSILGLGPSSVSYAMGETRYQNISSQSGYEKLLGEGKLPIEKGCFLSARDEMVNFIVLDCFHRGEINAQEFRSRFKTGIENVFGREMAGLRDMGVLTRNGANYLVADRALATYEVRRMFYDTGLLNRLARRFALSGQQGGRGVTLPSGGGPPGRGSPSGGPVFNRLGETRECHLGYKCNANCIFCYNPAGSKDFRPFKEAAKELINARDAGYRKISFSGGEPSLRPDLHKLILLASRLGFENISLYTNGILTSDFRLVKMLKKCGLGSVFVSVHSHFKETHEKLVGVGGAFESALKSIRNFQRSGINVNLVFVINNMNCRQMPGYLDYFSRRGVKAFTFAFPRYLGKFRNSGETGSAGKRLSAITWAGALPSIRKAVRAAGDNNVNAEFLNIPACILGISENLIGDMYRENSSLPGDTRESGMVGITRPKLKLCLNCRYLLRCPGPCEDYIDRFGQEGIHPIR